MRRLMINRRFRAAVVALLVTAARQTSWAAEPADADAQRAQRLQFMQEKFDEFLLFPADAPDKPLSTADEPVLHYANPVRESSVGYGATFLWLDARRPVAAASISIRVKGVFREFTSFTSRRLLCEREGAVVWAPESGGVLEESLGGAPAPRSSPRLRLAQMRNAARRFSATFVVPRTEDESTELRLLPQPVYRFSAEEAGIVDGALFAFVEANDPELFLVLEAYRPTPDASPEWRYSLARMSSVRLTVRLDGRKIWSTTGYWTNPRSRSDPYVEVSEGQYDSERAAAPEAPERRSPSGSP